MTPHQYGMLIGGESVEGRGAPIEVKDPANGQVIATVIGGTAEDVDAAVAAARAAFEDGRWSRLGPGERANILWRWADRLEAEADRLAELEARQAGKPIKLARYSDIPAAIDNIRFFAGAARQLEGRAAAEYFPTHTSVIRREPIGVVASVAPWNYPMLMAAWKLGPALAAGNTVVIKPAATTPLTTIEMARLALEAGMPPGVLNVVVGSDPEVAVPLTSHPDVNMVSLTGDTGTGSKIMVQAAATVKRCHLELGGKAPLIVFADADIDAAVEGALCGAFVNAGQDCTAACRIFVQQPKYEAFLSKLVARTKAIRLGPTLSPTTDLGPVISQRQLDRVLGFIERAAAAGAKVECGGRRAAEGALADGFYVEPTVISGAADDSEIMQREVFGPVTVVVPFDTEDEAVARANGVVYGLASSVWTTNTFTAANVARRLRFGTVWVNDHLPLTSEMPHGGFKQSGFGKDLSLYAFEEYTQIKHVMQELTGDVKKGWHFTIVGDVPQ
jgi:betaine-aldehyde dehydrogenase